MILKFLDEYVLSGECFSICRRIDIPANPSVLDIVIDPTNLTKTLMLMSHLEFNAVGAGPVFVDAYFNVTADDDGTQFIPINRDHSSSETAKCIVRVNPTVSDTGTKIPAEFLIPSISQGSSNTTGEFGENILCSMNLAGKYLFRFSNQDNSACDGAHIFMNWVETNK